MRRQKSAAGIALCAWLIVTPTLTVAKETPGTPAGVAVTPAAASQPVVPDLPVTAPQGSMVTMESRKDALETAANEQLADNDDRWQEFLADWSAPPVSAAGILGLSGESITTIDNKRNLTVALQGLLKNDPANSFGISITPARTSIAPMDLADYASSWIMRMLGNLTLSYAQGPITLEDVDYERKAYAIDTNFYFKATDDPALAFARGFASCKVFETPVPDFDEQAIADAVHAGIEEPARRPATNLSASAADTTARANACRANAEAVVNDRWNRSLLSIAYGEGRIRLNDNSKPEESLGKTLVVSVIYGFDGFGVEKKAMQALRRNFALTVNYRRSMDEPVLATLAQPQTSFANSSLFIARLTGGSESSRVFLEASDARSHDITASQRAFRRALGIDYRLYEGAWLNLRVGRQRTIDGTKEETGTLFSVSYSPAALLKQ